MRKKIVLFFAFLLLIPTFIFAIQPADSTLVNALSDAGINKGLAWGIIAVLSVVIGHFAIPQKWTSIFAYAEKILYVVYLAFAWFNEKTNKLSKAQKARFVPMFKMLIFAVFLSGISMSTNAQLPGKWNIFSPVPKYVQSSYKTSGDTINTKNGDWIPRIAGTVTTSKLTFEGGNLKSTQFIGAGAGLSFSYYAIKNGIRVNVASIDFMCALSTCDYDKGAFSTIIGGTFYKIVSLGVGYDWTNRQVGIFPKLTWIFD